VSLDGASSPSTTLPSKIDDDHRLRRQLVVGDAARLDHHELLAGHARRDVAARPGDEAAAATAPNRAAPRAGISLDAGTDTRLAARVGEQLHRQRALLGDPAAGDERSRASPCSSKLSMIRRLPKAIDSSSAR
jgi:hypothetical protein